MINLADITEDLLKQRQNIEYRNYFHDATKRAVNVAVKEMFDCFTESAIRELDKERGVAV